MATYTPPRTPGTPRARGGSPPPAAPGSVDPRHATRPGPRDPRTGTFSAPRHTRPFADPATGLVAEPAARPARPAPPAKPTTNPTTRPTTKRATRPTARPTARPVMGRTRPRHPRAPFILLLIGLLGGALVSLLVISTTLAEGSYRITNLQQQNANLAKQEQLLAQQVAQASSPAQIAQEAEQFGMRPNPNLQFINLKTGKVVSGHPSRADSEIDVPGYTP
jgi:hypothetical protein